MRLRSADPILELLDDFDFPASKQQIVEYARRHHAHRDVERALAALPLGDYANRDEVIRSVPLDPDPELTPAERAYQARHHRHPRLAEHMRMTELPPIEEEIDEARRRPGE